jgi:hypothetical protein
MSDVHRDKPVHSEPHSGPHADTKFEGRDASVGLVLGSLSAIALTLIVTAVVTFPIQNVLKTINPVGQLPSPLAPDRVVPTVPRLEVHPWNDFPGLRKHEDEVLTSSGTEAGGRTRMPIQQAIDQVASQLPIRPNAGPGLMVPGGQGRDFAGSLSGMPPAYQAINQRAAQTPAAKTGPTIQGEIRKNAKQ